MILNVPDAGKVKVQVGALPSGASVTPPTHVPVGDAAGVMAKVTVPLASVVPVYAGVTAALSVTAWFAATGPGEETAVVVAVELAATIEVPVAVGKFVSPLNVAVIVCEPAARKTIAHVAVAPPVPFGASGCGTHMVVPATVSVKVIVPLGLTEPVLDGVTVAVKIPPPSFTWKVGIFAGAVTLTVVPVVPTVTCCGVAVP